MELEFELQHLKVLEHAMEHGVNSDEGNEIQDM